LTFTNLQRQSKIQLLSSGLAIPRNCSLPFLTDDPFLDVYYLLKYSETRVESEVRNKWRLEFCQKYLANPKTGYSFCSVDLFVAPIEWHSKVIRKSFG
jgi:hypothetical protein